MIAIIVWAKGVPKNNTFIFGQALSANSNFRKSEPPYVG